MEDQVQGPASDRFHPLDDMADYDPGVALYLQELQKEDIALADAERALEKARFNFELALRRYALVRDVFRERFAFDPYGTDGIGTQYENELEDTGMPHEPFPTLGRYRFVHMSPGDAVVAALDEAEQPLTLDEILAVLRQGGMHVPDGRTINAALRNTAEVRRLSDGRYRKVKPRKEAVEGT